MGSATITPPLPPGFQLDAPQPSQTSSASSNTPPLPPGFSLDAPSTGPTLGPQPELTPQAEDTIAQAMPGGNNPVTEAGNRYLTIPVVKALLKVHDAIQSAQNLSSGERDQHPVEAKLGDLSAAIEGLLTGNQDRPDEAIGSGEYGVLNNPVTVAVMGAPDAADLAAEKIPGAASQTVDAIRPVAQKVMNTVRAIGASTDKGKAALETASTAANAVPIDTVKITAIAKQIESEGSHGGYVPKVISDFLKRADDGTPITYKEGRQFYVHSGKLSSTEESSLDGPTRALVNQFNAELDNANYVAAQKAGVGEQYKAGMEQIRLASNRSRAGEHLANIPTIGKTVKETGAAAKDISAGAKERTPTYPSSPTTSPSRMLPAKGETGVGKVEGEAASGPGPQTIKRPIEVGPISQESRLRGSQPDASSPSGPVKIVKRSGETPTTHIRSGRETAPIQGPGGAPGTAPNAPKVPTGPLGLTDQAPARVKVTSGYIDPKRFIAHVSAPESHVNSQVVGEYRKAIQSGKPMVPAKMYFDKGGNLIGADGRHRAAAAITAGLKKIPVEIHQQLD